MSETITLARVDTELLEKQRKTLIKYLCSDWPDEAKVMGVMDDQTEEALEGILNMLDAWSDEYHNEGSEPCGK